MDNKDCEFRRIHSECMPFDSGNAKDSFHFCFQQIFVTAFLVACTVAQQQSPRQQADLNDRTTSTTTWIPILAYNKEQGQDGSYKAS